MARLQNIYLRSIYLLYLNRYLRTEYLQKKIDRYLRNKNLQNRYLRSSYLQNIYPRSRYLENRYLHGGYVSRHNTASALPSTAGSCLRLGGQRRHKADFIIPNETWNKPDPAREPARDHGQLLPRQWTANIFLQANIFLHTFHFPLSTRTQDRDFD